MRTGKEKGAEQKERLELMGQNDDAVMEVKVRQMERGCGRITSFGAYPKHTYSETETRHDKSKIEKLRAGSMSLTHTHTDFK